MKYFDDNFWRMVEEADRLRRLEELRGIDRHTITMMNDLAQQHAEARRLLGGMFHDPSHILLRDVSFTSPLTESARAANLAGIELLRSLQPREGVFEQIKQLSTANISAAWLEPLPPAKELPYEALRSAVGAHLSWITEMSVLAETSLARFPWKDVGALTRLPVELRAPIRDEFLGLTRSYETLLTSFRESESSILVLPPRASELSAREFFLGSRLVKAVSVEAPEDEVEEESEELEREIGEAVADELEAMLARLDAGFVSMREGARRALESDNPDKVRHFITSYRELGTHILHRLSPDNEVKAWSTSPDDFANGKPTRKARLRFICRNINHGPLTGFMEKDIEATVNVFDVLNQGTHQVSSSLTEPQLVAIRTKAEAAILFMLTISQV